MAISFPLRTPALGMLRIIPRHLALIPALLAVYPLRSAAVLLALFVAGLAEGIGLLTLLPVLEITLQTSEELSPIARSALTAVNALGLPASHGSLLALIALLIVVKAALVFFAQYFANRTAANFVTELRHSFIRALLASSLSSFLHLQAGRISTIVAVETTNAATVYRGSCELVASSVQTCLLLAGTFLISPEITIGGIAIGILLTASLGSFMTVTRKSNERLLTLMRSLNSRLADAVRGIKPVKAMNAEIWIAPVLQQENRDMNRTLRRYFSAKQTMNSLREPIMVCALAAGLYFIIESGSTSITQAITGAVLFYRAATAIGQIQQAYEMINAAEPFYSGVVRTLTELEQKRETERGDKLPPVPRLQHTLHVHELAFRYGERTVLSGVNIEVRIGRLTAIIGPSGSGKSTLGDLLCRLLIPSSGRILVDGLPLDQFSISSWREQIGYVPQDLFLFNDTVLKNVTLADPGLSRTDAEQALRAAGAWDFVSQLENGIDTVIGEQGGRLSGGQRQRLSIARALVRKPRLLILDEATTALDPVTEGEICQTLRQLAANIAIVAISHQPALVSSADVVYRLEHGAIVQVEEVDHPGQPDKAIA